MRHYTNFMAQSRLNAFERASRHPISRDKPAVDFFEGALLGNGGLGAVVTTRPDAVAIHFGHNNVWDIRIAEDHKDKIGTFQEVYQKVKAVSASCQSLSEDEWCREYFKMTAENYSKSYPRPFPCGTLILGFDRRRAELLGHRLHINTGRCDVNFEADEKRIVLQIFTEMTADRLWLRTVDAEGRPVSSPFNRMRLIPDPETPSDLPSFTVPDSLPASTLSFHQVLPFQEPHVYDKTKGHPKDRCFRLTLRVSDPLKQTTRTNTWSGPPETMGPLERALISTGAFVGCVQLDEGLASEIPVEDGGHRPPLQQQFEDALRVSHESWREFWNQSAVKLDDDLLERIWYWNLYFLNCSVKPGVTCPGLFANWSYRNIGTAWHGDYHMNYNTQQPFWATFSSNHVEKHLPYVDLVDHLRPISRQWAKEYYGLRGAYFPHSAYPVEMTMMPYPVPTWGWEICETPWTVQSLWWHYLYTQDKQFLKERAFEPIREAVLFLVDYMKRPEAHGPQWGDDRYHIFPTVPPELYGLQPGFDKNHDCLVDLTLSKFVFHAFLHACAELRLDSAESELIHDARAILDKFPAYPTADSSHGKVFVSVQGENPEIVCNTPNTLMTVFPGEDHGLHSPPLEFAIAANSYRAHRNEGGNELVFLNLQAARLGMLDLEKWKRQILYCLLPNGTCADMALQVHGRYNDNTPYDFMGRMGIWFENFALPVVINECLLQSYNGWLRLFPNWPKQKTAEFRSLRAVGAFLVSARCAQGAVEWLEARSEVGGTLRLINPWPGGAMARRSSAEQSCREEKIQLETSKGETIQFRPL